MARKSNRIAIGRNAALGLFGAPDRLDDEPFPLIRGRCLLTRIDCRYRAVTLSLQGDGALI